MKLCLTAPGKPRQIVEIEGSSSVADLYEKASEVFTDATIETLRAGFPPKPLEISSATIDGLIANNERITVILGQVKTTKKKNGATKKKTSANPNPTTSSSNTPTGKRTSKRAAAKAATESFAEVIKAQDKMMEEQSSKRQRRAPTSNNNNNRRASNKNAAAAARRMARMPGRRLGDGAAVNGAAPQQRKNTGGKLKSENDVSFALMNALNTGGGGKVGQVLRGAMKNAVNRTYDASKARARVGAVQSGKFTITEDNDHLKITFAKGIEGRGNIEESVDHIPEEALKAVISAIHSSDEESLRPGILAQLSPRVFWSLLHHTTVTGGVEMALEALLPDLDWSFLKRRKQQLSEKAIENLRQEKEATGQAEENIELAEEAVQAVERAMEQVQSYDESRKRNRMIEAALSRQQPEQQEEAKWVLLTPDEEDEDELMECCGGDKDVVKKLLRSNIHNWRELANADSKQLSAKVNTDESAVEDWIAKAQQESIEEIIVEICDGDPEAVAILRDEARTGTPKDLANWRSMPDMLLESAPSLKGVEAERVSTWCHRSYALLQEWEWMNWYATPVE